MNTHLTREQLQSLRDGTLRPAEVAEAGAHAATCEACGNAVAESLAIDRRIRDLRIQIEAEDDGEHLSEDALLAYADRTMRNEERDMARVHLEECESCRAELEEIDRLKTFIRPRRRWLPYAIAASVAAAAVSLLLLNRPSDSPIPHKSPSTTRIIRQPPVVPGPAGYGRKDWDQWVADVRARRQLPVPAVVEGLRVPKSPLRTGEEQEDLQLRPNGAVVTSSRPHLQWARREGASYVVILKIGDRIMESGTLNEPEWTPSIDLKRGREYAWQVEVRTGDVKSIHPNPPARFRVLDQSALNEIADARKRYPDDFLLQVVILARHGLREEALAGIDRLSRSDAELASALRQSLRKWPR